MIQLKYTDEFNEIMEDIHYWTTDTIPSNIYEFINNINNKKVIYERENDAYYCAKCFSKLNNHYCCPKCHKKNKRNFTNTIFINNLKEPKSPNTEFYYYAFDIINNQVYLYELKEVVHFCYNNYPIKTSQISINKVFLIQNNCLFDIYNSKLYNYSRFITEYNEIQNHFENNTLDEIKSTEITDFILEHRGYLYVDNLPYLKKTSYKYTFIWNSTNYLKNNDINIYEIVILPLTNKNFEYLIKYKLYTLAYCNNLEFKNNFPDTFGLSKDYLPFMVKYDININELTLLKILKTKDIKLLKKLSIYTYIIIRLHDEYHLNIIKLIEYFNEKKLNYTYLNDYLDYIEICHEIGINLKDHQFLYPNNFFASHNEIVNQYETITNKDVDEKIRKISGVLQVNKYEDNEYIIYPADSLKSIIEEGFNQNNCVRTYAKSYSEGECQIYFMRKKKRLHKSLVTIEVVNNRVIQARIKNNLLPNSELTKIINKWERQLILITTHQ